MKKILFALFMARPVAALADSAMFGMAENQIHASFVDIGGASQIFVHYSQPNRFFRLQGRRNISFVGMRGENYDRPVNQTAVGITQDVAVFGTDSFYAGAGIGPYLKLARYPDSPIGGSVMFGSRFFTGYRCGRFGAELVLQHFSNGSLALPNLPFNGAGVGINYNF
ncbi:MAG: acyloxyacyl hydrolase [Rickettsiales bacterium]|nr:acyloxyacyl hydrolase [Rickettsiales bacterium]